MGFRSSSQLTGGTGNTAAVPVPSGATSGDIAVVGIYKENTANITGVPSGFTNKISLTTSAGSRGSLHVYWKRLTAGDTGTYSFSWSGNTWRSAACSLWSGRVASGDPFDGTVGTAESTTSVSTLNVSTSPANANGDAVGMWTDFTGGNSWTAPTNYTERVDIDTLGLFTRDAVASGSTGSISATANVSGFLKAFLGVLQVAGGGGSNVSGTAAATFGALSATASGVPTVTATASAPLGPLAATATGAVSHTGTAAAPLGGLAATATGLVSVAGTAAAPLGGLTASASGATATAGTGTAPLGALTAAASGTVTVPGAASAPLGALVATATGTTIGAGAGTATAQFGSLAAAGSGMVSVGGAATAALGALVASAAGTRATTAATAAALLGGLVASATGTRFTTGTAVALLGALVAGAVIEPPVTRGNSYRLSRTAPAAASALRGATGAGMLGRTTAEGSLLDRRTPSSKGGT